MRRKIIDIKCSNCGKIVFRYHKIGKGTVWHCWKKRILEDHSIRKEDKVKCSCGNLIGTEKKRRIKMKQHSFEKE
ncbi:MAG: hypothetical protein V5A68_02135 [Candidatus Thermoplasmatota archaeon]